VKPSVLYLSMLRESPSHEAKLSGVRRFCEMRGWEAVPVPREGVSPEVLPELFRRYRPVVGCVADGIGSMALLPPRLFRSVPVCYIGYPPGTTGRRLNLRFDARAIAAAALRELSAGRPSGYAAVGNPRLEDWSLRRVRAFRSAVRAGGGRCFVFPALPDRARESEADFTARLVPWLAGLPERCAVFAVSDQTAVLVARAAHAARRPVPRSLTLLSVDNFEALCESADPPISSIQLDFEREGFLAASVIGEHACWRTGGAGGKRPSPHTVLGPLLTVRRMSTSGRGRHESWVLDAVQIIRREACDGLAPAALVARLKVSKSLFNLRFRETTGHSVLDEITHVRLEKATTLLAQTDTAIGAVPALCGYSCDRTLDAVFRARFGMGMREWRKRNRRRPCV